MRFATASIHAGEVADFESGSGDVVRPIHLSTTFARKAPETPTRGYEYTRTGNPTRNSLEEKLAAIEGAKYAVAYSSGLASETSVLLSVLKAGDRIFASDDLYGGTRRIFDNVIKKFGVDFETFDFSDLSALKSIPGGTKIVWIETPSNPLLKIIDIREAGRIAHDNGSILVVDNTFATPYFQNPLSLGADVVIHSTTKYISGHSDSLGGAAIVNDKQTYEKLKYHQNAIGAVLSPFDSYLTMRGIKTLSVRMNEHEKNAFAIAKYLLERKEVEDVYFPGLESHKDHELAKNQMRGFGGIVSFKVNLETERIRRFLKNLRYISLGESLGGVESLIEIPSLMTHASVPKEMREKIGVTDNLIRFSVGIEDKDDLLEDLDNAFGSA